MKTTNIRILSLIFALILCLSTLLTACGGESKNASEEEGTKDIEEVLTNAYKQTKKVKSLKMDIEQKNEGGESGTQKSTASGQFAKNEDKDLVGYVTETTDQGTKENYYHFDTCYVNSESGSYVNEAERPYTIETACLEQWVLAYMNVRDFKTFAKELGKSDAEMTNEDGEITITLECKALELVKITLGKELYDTWYENLKGDEYLYSEFNKGTATLSIDIDEEGRLTRIDMKVTTPSETSKITVRLSQFGKNFDIVRPEWANVNSPVGGGESGGGTQEYEPAYIHFTQDDFNIGVGEEFYISNYFQTCHFESIHYESLNAEVATVDTEDDYGLVRGVADGSAYIRITVSNGDASTSYQIHVTVDSKPLIRTIDVKDEIVVYMNTLPDFWDYVEIYRADSIEFYSSDTDILAITAEHKFLLKSEGTVILNITAQNEAGETELTIPVTIKSSFFEIYDVNFFEQHAKINLGETFDLCQNMFTLAEELHFESADPHIAAVGGDDGIIRGIGTGSTYIYVYAVQGEVPYLAGKFPVVVQNPWNPKSPISRDAVNILNSGLKKINKFLWFNTSITSIPQYNLDNLTSATAGPAEIWVDTLHLLFRFDKKELDATIGIEDPETYNYYFDFYYRPYDESNDRGDYQKATLQPWSIYNDQIPVYRCKFYDAFFVENDGLIEDQLYELVVAIRQGDTLLAYAETELYWTDSCAAFVSVAERVPTIIK